MVASARAAFSSGFFSCASCNRSTRRNGGGAATASANANNTATMERLPSASDEMGGRQTVPTRDYAAGQRTIRPGGSNEQGASDQKNRRSWGRRMRAVRNVGEPNRRRIRFDRCRKWTNQRRAKFKSLGADLGGERLNDLPVAAPCASNNR